MTEPAPLKFLPLIILAGLIGTAGCSSRPTMQDLEREAMETGDWSEVEKRQQMDRRMGRVNPDQECPTGYALLCSKNGEREICECVNSNDIRAR